MTEPLFRDDQIPECSPTPTTLLRQMERRLDEAKARLAKAEDPTYDDRCWEAERLELDPLEYEELYNEAEAYRAMEREVCELEKQAEAAREAVLAEMRGAKP
jgi:hypothetical protein